MYALLPVDDEPLELETLKDYIPWDTVGVGEIFTAANGDLLCYAGVCLGRITPVCGQGEGLLTPPDFGTVLYHFRLFKRICPTGRSFAIHW